MSVLIKGMKMPECGRSVHLRIDDRGEVYIYGSYPTELYEAVELPPHGRLIDILDVPDALRNYFDIGDSYVYNLTRVKEAFAVGTVHLDDFVEWDENDIDELTAYISANTPAIIEAEEEG